MENISLKTYFTKTNEKYALRPINNSAKTKKSGGFFEPMV